MEQSIDPPIAILLLSYIFWGHEIYLYIFSELNGHGREKGEGGEGRARGPVHYRASDREYLYRYRAHTRH